MTTLLPLGLVLHITGITLMAGTFFAGFLTNDQLWKYLPYNKEQALPIARATSRFRIAQAVGGGLIVVRLRQYLFRENPQPDSSTLLSTQRRLGLFNMLQLILFLVIFIISSYKFN